MDLISLLCLSLDDKTKNGGEYSEDKIMEFLKYV